MDTKNIAVLMCGRTHSGKTTFGMELSKELSKNVVIDNDDVDLFLKQKFAGLHNDPEVRAHRTPTDPDLRLLVPQVIYDYALRNHYNVILTASHSRRAIRAKQREIAKKNNAIFVIVFLDFNDKTILDRIKNSHRSTEVLNGPSSFEEEIARQKSFFEDPSPDEADIFFHITLEEQSGGVKAKIIDLV